MASRFLRSQPPSKPTYVPSKDAPALNYDGADPLFWGDAYGNAPGGTADDDQPSDPAQETVEEKPSLVPVPAGVKPVAIPSVTPRTNPPKETCPAHCVQPTHPSGSLARFLEDTHSTARKLTRIDRTDPRVTSKQDATQTVVLTPTEPQHISEEIARVAPSVSADLLAEFSKTLLVSLGTTGAQIAGFINGLAKQAQALGDQASQLFADGMKAVLAAAPDFPGFVAQVKADVASAVDTVAEETADPAAFKRKLNDGFGALIGSIDLASLANPQALLDSLTRGFKKLADDALRDLGDAKRAELERYLTEQLLASIQQAVIDHLPNFGGLEQLLANGFGSTINQAAAMTNLRQVPAGIFSPFAATEPVLTLATDALTRANWPLGKDLGLAGTLQNGQNVVRDLFNNATGLCICGQGVNNLGTAASLVAQGLQRPALNAQLDGIVKLMAITPFHTDGVNQLLHAYRAAANQAPAAPVTVTGLKTEVQALLAGGSNGGMPGTILKTAYEGSALPEDYLLEAPPKVAASLGSTQQRAVRSYLRDPDETHDALTPILPQILVAGDPEVGKLFAVMRAFQGVVQSLVKLTPTQVADLNSKVTEVGSEFVQFTARVRAQSAQLGPLDKLAPNYLNNRFTVVQRDLVRALVTVWSGLAASYGNVAEPRRSLVKSVIDARDAVFDSTDDVAAILDQGTDKLDAMGGETGPEIAYATATQMALIRVQLLANDETVSDADLERRSAQILTDTEDHVGELTYGGPYQDYVRAVAAPARAGEGLAAMNQAGLEKSVQLVGTVLDLQQKTTVVSASQMTQERGKNLFDVREHANETDITKENKDTQSRLAGVLSHHRRSIDTILKRSLPEVSGLARTIGDTGVTTAPTQRAKLVENLVKQTANALASTTLNKVSGVRLNQQYEGAVNQAKFILTQAGSALTQEAPFVRTTAYGVHAIQGGIVLVEGDAIDVRGQWLYQNVQHAVGLATTDYDLFAKGRAVLSGGELNLFGQSGVKVADRKGIVLSAGVTVGSQASLSLNDTGDAKLAAKNIRAKGATEVTVSAGTKVVLKVGNSAIVISSDRIDLNPSVVPVLTEPGVETVEIKYVEAKPLATTANKAPAKLPSQKGRNPVPVATPEGVSL